jgi:hypothetical protein
VPGRNSTSCGRFLRDQACGGACTESLSSDSGGNLDEQLLLAVEAANGGDATTGAEEVAVPPSRGGPTWYSMVFIEYQSFLKKWIYIVYASCVFN